MKHTKVICEKCNGEVVSSADLVTDTYVVGVVAYHERCYVQDIKGGRSFFLSNVPLNGFASNLTTIFTIIIALLLAIFADSERVIALLAIIPLGYRLYSYLVYERHLKEQKH